MLSMLWEITKENRTLVIIIGASGVSMILAIIGYITSKKEKKTPKNDA